MRAFFVPQGHHVVRFTLTQAGDARPMLSNISANDRMMGARSKSAIFNQICLKKIVVQIDIM